MNLAGAVFPFSFELKDEQKLHFNFLRVGAIAKHSGLSFAIMSPKLTSAAAELNFLYVLTEQSKQQFHLSFVDWVEVEDQARARPMDGPKFAAMRRAFESCIGLGVSPSHSGAGEKIWVLFTRDARHVVQTLIVADEGAGEFFQFGLTEDGSISLV